jgi:protein-L-isoaspartate O-methyltransferase
MTTMSDALKRIQSDLDTMVRHATEYGIHKQRLVEEGTAIDVERRRYEARIGVRTSHIATIVRPENTRWMMDRMRERIADKVVVEIGAGLGVLAVEMAKTARRVFAIDSDPEFSASFAASLYQSRPPTLTYIFDSAENVIASGLHHAMRADLAVVVTGSNEGGLRALAEKFVRGPGDVIMPWQDYNGGVACCDYRGHVAPCDEPTMKGAPWLR